MMVGLISLWWCFHVDSWHVMSLLLCILDLESWLAFFWPIILVSMSMVFFEHLLIEDICFHCIVIEHILEYLLWRHFVPYVGHYLTLGHTPIFEFIRSFTDLITIWSISWFLWVVLLRHTPFSALLLGHTPSLGLSYLSLTLWSFVHFANPFRVITLGHTPFLIEFIIPVTSLRFVFVVDHIPCFLFLL